MFWCNLVFVRERDGELWNRCSWESLICIRPTLFVNLMNVHGATCANSLLLDLSPTPPLDAKEKYEKYQCGDTLWWRRKARVLFYLCSSGVCSLAPLIITWVIDSIAETAGLRGLKGHRTCSQWQPNKAGGRWNNHNEPACISCWRVSNARVFMLVWSCGCVCLFLYRWKRKHDLVK